MAKKKLKYEESHKIIDGVSYKLCNRCNEWFPCDEQYFYKTNTDTKDGLFPDCIKCEIKRADKRQRAHIKEHNKYTLERYYLNPKDNKSKKDAATRSRLRGNNKRWQQLNPDKLKIYAENHNKHIITKEQWEACQKFFDYQCAYCGMTKEEHKRKFNQRLHREHARRNAGDGIDNCIPSCKSCNSEKHDSDLDDWYNSNNKKYTEARYKKIILFLDEYSRTLK